MSDFALMRALAYSALGNLPSQRFFSPLNSFWATLDEIIPTDVQLVDAGCGMGDLILEAKEHGRKLLGIDVGYRKGQHKEIEQRSAITYPWNDKTWIMMCRPSHDGWCFEAAENARRRGAHVLYVGLPSNYKRDLGSIRSRCIGKVGMEGEKLYLIEPFKRGKA